MEKARSETEKKTIVMIDDEEDFCHFVKLNLEKNGRFKVYTATRGSDGISIIGQVKPDLILLDIVMQDMDGGEVAFNLKKSGDTKDIPIIFITAILQPAEEDKLRGKHHFLSKPITPDRLIKKINTILDMKKQI
ncbi:MAG: response regulator [Syntrophaceae bacterium]